MQSSEVNSYAKGERDEETEANNVISLKTTDQGRLERHTMQFLNPGGHSRLMISLWARPSFHSVSKDLLMVACPRFLKWSGLAR